MAITKAKKTEIIGRLQDILKDSATLVFVGFKGVSVQDTTAMRKTLREQGVGYFVAKKSLIRRALGEASVTGVVPELPGEVAVAYGTDEIIPAQGIRGFEKRFKNQLSILGGVFAGEYKDKAEMSDIASVPTLPILRGMFVNVINSPIQGLALALNAIAEKKV